MHVLQEEQKVASPGETNANQILTNDVDFDSFSDKSKTLRSFSSQEKQESVTSQAYQHWAFLDHDSLANESIPYQTLGMEQNLKHRSHSIY